MIINEDNFEYDYNTYEGKDFSNRTALSIVHKLLLADNAELSKPEKLQIVERLKKIDKKGVIDEFFDGDIGDVIDEAQEKLLDDGQMLLALDEKIAAEKYDHTKASLIIQKAELLNGMNRQKNATHSNKEKEYYGIKQGIETLSKVRPECHAKAVTLRDNLIRLYPRKPLFLSILKQLDL